MILKNSIQGFFYGFFLLSFSFCTCTETQPSYFVIENEAKLPILTPSLTNQQTLKMRLRNGLEIYLISDPETDMSAASLSVNAGSWSDPKKYPGMAHFLEHMLFLGNKKYPNESEFQRFIDNHGGKENAYTASDRTVFSFSIANEAFPEALDRFAQFFISPLFNPSGVGREAHAVDQEYAKNIENDSWRLLFIRKALENPDHPDSRFNIGNLQTISKITPDTLKKWYEQHYSSNLMHLVIYSNLPMETLKNLVQEDFSAIENKELTPLNVTAPLLTSENCNKLIYITPYQDIRHLVIFWTMPAKYKYEADIVSYGLGDESGKSLLANLKEQGLAEDLSAGASRYGNEIVFSIDISLTEQGVKNVEPVIVNVFETIYLLKEKGIPEFFFNEIRDMAKIKYQYQSRLDPFEIVTNYADALIDEKMETFPEYSLIPQRYDPEGMSKVIDYLQQTPCQFYVLADPKITGVHGNLKEPWLGGEYAILPLPATIHKALSNIEVPQKIDLPDANPFVPNKLDLVPIGTSATKSIGVKNLPLPLEILNNESGQYYYASDSIYKVPEIVYTFRIHTPTVLPGNATNAVLLELFIKEFKDSIASTAYQASMANLSFKLDALDTGLSLSIQGYSEKSSLLLKDILKGFKNFSIDDREFEQIKYALLTDYENNALDSPLKQAQESLKSIIYKDYVTSTEKVTALKQVSKNELLEFVRNLFLKTYVQGMLCGNLTQQDALAVIKEIHSTLSSQPYPKEEITRKAIILLPNDKGPFILSKRVSPQGNAALLAIENSCYSFKSHAALEILSKGLEEPFFSELRTKQQTGYIVGSVGQVIQKQLFNFFMVQSYTFEPRDLLARFSLMIDNFLQSLTTENIPEDRFTILKKTVAYDLMQPPKNLKEMTLILEALAFEYNGQFERLDKRLAGINELSYSEFVDFAFAFLGKENLRKLAILVEGRESENLKKYKIFKSREPIRSMSQYFTREDSPECSNNLLH